MERTLMHNVPLQVQPAPTHLHTSLPSSLATAFMQLFPSKFDVLHGMQVLCQGKLVLCTCIHSNLCLAAQPAGLQRQPRLARRGCRKQTLWRRCATEDTSKGTDVVDVQKIGTIPFSRDEETLVDVMAFAGPAPEVMQQPVMAFPSLSFLFARN